MKEFIERIRKPCRRGGEFRDPSCLKALSNRFSLKISVIDSMKKLLEVFRSSFEDYITLAHHDACPFAMQLSMSMLILSLQILNGLKRTMKRFLTSNCMKKATKNSYHDLVPNLLPHFPGDTAELAMSRSVTDEECRQRLALINN